ncbi:MAG: hypothetical protein ABEJ70_00805 [Halobacteriaceae archaeon]
MLGPPVDAWYAHLGLAVAGVAAVGLVLGVPTAPAPAPAPVADTVDRVAATTHPTVAVRSVDADAVRLGPDRVALRTDGGTASATFAYGPVVPVGPGSRLRFVLAGASPARVYDDPAAFRRAVGRARRRRPTWRRIDRIRVRGVSWGDVDVTLVG